MEEATHEVATRVVEFSGLYLIALIPLVGSVINATLGATLQKRFGRWAVHTIALTAVWASFVVAMYAVGMSATPASTWKPAFSSVSVSNLAVLVS